MDEMIVACDVSTTDDDPDPEEDVEEDTDVKTGDEDDGRSVGLVDDCGGGELVLGGGLLFSCLTTSSFATGRAPASARKERNNADAKE